MDDGQKKSLLKRIFSGPASAIAAAVVGGIFSITSALLPRFLPPNPDPPVGTAATVTSSVTAEPAAKSNATAVRGTTPHLTYGTWTLLESTDAEGNDWSNSVLKFTEQRVTEDGLELKGFFEWRNGTTLLGKEYVTGNYVASTRNLYFEGQSVEQVNQDKSLAVGSFSARLAEDNRHLIDGTWGSAAGHDADVPGTWRARR